MLWKARTLSQGAVPSPSRYGTIQVGVEPPWGSKADCEQGEKIHCGLYYAEHFSVSSVVGISGGSFVTESLEHLYKMMCTVKDLRIPV